MRCGRRQIAILGGVALGCACAAASTVTACSSFGGDAEGPDSGDASNIDGAARDGTSADGASADDGGSNPACGVLGGAVQTLATGEVGAASGSADAIHAYWVANGTLRRVPVAGGTSESIATDAGATLALVLTNGYVVVNGAAGIYARDKQQLTGADIVVYGYPGAAILAPLGGDEVAFARPDAAYRKQIPGGFLTPLTTEPGVFAAAYSAPNVVYLSPANGTSVLTCDATSKCGTQPGTVLAKGQSNTVAVAVDSTHAYWIDDSRVHRVSLAGGNVEDVMTGLVAPKRVAVDGTDVYVSMQAGGIARAPKGGPLCTVSPGTATISSMSLFGDYVYFTTPDTVARIHK